MTICRGVQVSGTKRGPKSPKFPPKIGLLRWIFDIHLPDTLHTASERSNGQRVLRYSKVLRVMTILVTVFFHSGSSKVGDGEGDS